MPSERTALNNIAIMEKQSRMRWKLEVETHICNYLSHPNEQNNSHSLFRVEVESCVKYIILIDTIFL